MSITGQIKRILQFPQKIASLVATSARLPQRSYVKPNGIVDFKGKKLVGSQHFATMLQAQGIKQVVIDQELGFTDKIFVFWKLAFATSAQLPQSLEQSGLRAIPAEGELMVTFTPDAQPTELETVCGVVKPKLQEKNLSYYKFYLGELLQYGKYSLQRRGWPFKATAIAPSYELNPISFALKQATFAYYIWRDCN